MTRGRYLPVCCGHPATDHALLDGERCYHPGCNCLSLRLPSAAAVAFADRWGRPDPAWKES